VDPRAIPSAAEQQDLPEVLSNTAPDDIASILLERLENESIRVGSRNGSNKG